MKLLVVLLLIGGSGGLLAWWRTGRRARKLCRLPRKGGILVGTGFLELQSMLEPEKKVEIFLKKEDRTVQEESGEPPA